LSASEQQESLPFELPAVDLERQAVDVWRGFEYQLFQALHAWLRLPENAFLFLEVAEDHATYAETQIEQTQVKDLSENLTLRSEAATGLLESHWRLQEANPTLEVTSVLLTTAKSGKERGVLFPDNKGGLEHWRVVAREGTDVAPLRNFLKTLDLSTDLKNFIQESTDEQFRERLIRPIKWICASEDLETIRQSVLDSLVYLGNERQVPTSESERACDSLLAELRTVILRKEVRKVTKADLLRAFEKATFVSVPRAVADEYLRSAGTSNVLSINASGAAVRDVSRIPLPPRIARRSDLVADMLTLSATKGILWLYGSSGLGKTTLALLMGKTTPEKWLFLDLRECPPLEIQHRILTTAHSLAHGGIRGVIVDDYPVDESRSTLLTLAQLTMEAYLQDVAVVFTTTRKPPPTVVSRLGEENVELRELPYLSEEEVAELVIEAGGDASQWAKVIHLFCHGHPQLIDARIAGLKSRNWPASEILGDVAPIFNSKEVREEKDAIRLRLMKELPERASELLCRLSLATNGFDRSLAMAVADAQVPVSRPGDAFTYLLGPWIEARGEDNYAFSPLVSGCGSSALSATQQSVVRKSIVKNLIERHPFPAEQLGQLLINAFIEKDVNGLLWFAEAMQQYALSDWKMFKLLAREVSFLVAFSITDPLFESNGYISALLRVIQCFVAVETEVSKVPAIFDRMIQECRQIADNQVSAGLLFMAVSRVLMQQGIGLSPKQWLPLVIELPRLLKTCSPMGATFAQAIKEEPYEWSLDQFLFVVQASSLPNIDALANLFDQLNQMKTDSRKYFLSALSRDTRSRRLAVDNAWLNETKKGTLDGSVAAEQYQQLSERARSWGEVDLLIDCLCAQAVMLDEYADRPQDALTLLDESIKDLGADHRLLRRRQVVLVGQGEHEAALQAFPNIEDGYAHDAIDRMYSLRDAGRSASETGKFSEARRYFCEASAAADDASQSLIPMSAGLLADAAFVAFQENDFLNALTLLKQAILKAEKIDPDATGLDKYCLIILGHISAWMLERVEAGPTILELQAGVCSNPNPGEEILQRDAPRPLMLWYQLAILEVKLCINVGALRELRQRTRETGLFALEHLLARSQLIAAIKLLEPDELLRILPNYFAFNALLGKMDVKSVNVMTEPVNLPIAPVMKRQWNEENHRWFLENAVISFSLLAIASEKETAQDTLIDRLANSFTPGTKIANFLTTLTAEVKEFPTENLNVAGAACASVLRKAKVQVTPEQALRLTYYLWGWLQNLDYRSCIENDVARCISSIWQRLISECRCMLINPTSNIPPIESILEGSTTGVERLAALALAAEKATSTSFTSSMREELQEFLETTK
jgi:hypothetical protein